MNQNGAVDATNGEVADFWVGSDIGGCGGGDQNFGKRGADGHDGQPDDNFGKAGTVSEPFGSFDEEVGGFDEEGEGHRKQDERDVVVVDARILKQRVEGQNPEKQSAVEHERVTHQKLGNARWGGNSVVSHASWNDPHFLTVATECHGGGEFTEPLNRVALECL